MKNLLPSKILFFTVLSILFMFLSCKDSGEEIQQHQNDSALKTGIVTAINELNTLKNQIEASTPENDRENIVKTAKIEVINKAITKANNVVNSTNGDYKATVEDLGGLIYVLNGNVSAFEDLLNKTDFKISANKNAIELQKIILDKYLLITNDDEIANAINALKTELESELEALEHDIVNQSERITELSNKIDAINATLNVLNFEHINNMITEIVFQYDGNTASGKRLIDFKTAPAKLNYIFGENLAGAIEFVKDMRVIDNEAQIEVKVSPVNADLSKMIDQIYLIRRDGNNEVNNFIKAVKAERSTALRAAPSVTGIWNITFSMPATANMNDLLNLIGDEEGNYSFAVAIENNVDSESNDRYVVSEFGLIINAEIATSVYNSIATPNKLNFSVGTGELFYSHTLLRNRYLYSVSGMTAPADKRWAGSGWSSAESIENDANDNRSSAVYNYYAVEAGKPFSVKIDEPEQIFAYYVVLDTAWAVENTPIERNSWLEYNYTGINKVYKADEVANISINSTVAINDIIGFRIVAVNFDGTLVDPDGKSFYVVVGAQSASWSDVNTAVTALNPNEKEPIATESTSANVVLSKLTEAATFEWSTDETELEGITTPAFNVYFADENDVVIFSAVNSTGTVGGSVDFSKVKYVYTKAAVNNWLAYEDNKIYKGVLRIKNSNGNLLTTMNISFKKVLPTVAPEGFIEKTGQFTGDLYNGYLIPAKSPNNGATWNETWNATTGATHGMMMLDQLFNFGTGKLSNFVTTFADSEKDGENIVALKVRGAGPLAVQSEFIDNETSHVSTVEYSYGYISTANPEEEYTVMIKQFRTIYSNIYNYTYTWNWATREQLELVEEDALPYKTEVIYGAGTTDGGVTYPAATINLAHIFGVSERDSRYSAPLSAPYLNSLKFDADTPVKLVTTSVGINEYFNATLSGNIITLTGKSGATNPTVDVPSTLIINAIDMYGNKIEIKLPMTVKKR